MDGCLPGSEEFERRKDMMRLMGYSHYFDRVVHYILCDKFGSMGSVMGRSAITEDDAWERAWEKLNRQ